VPGRITRHGACSLPRPVTDSTPADDNEKTLRQRVRAALAARMLPMGRLSSVVRRGTGRACMVCGRVTEPTELEYEVRLDDRENQAVFVHEGCYRLWRVETNAIVGKDLDRGPTP
jgi:hypothetical protein